MYDGKDKQGLSEQRHQVPVKVEKDRRGHLRDQFVTGGTSCEGCLWCDRAIAVSTKSGSTYVAAYVVMVSDKFTQQLPATTWWIPLTFQQFQQGCFLAPT
jgi:hypothetical protein